MALAHSMMEPQARWTVATFTRQTVAASKVAVFTQWTAAASTPPGPTVAAEMAGPAISFRSPMVGGEPFSCPLGALLFGRALCSPLVEPAGLHMAASMIRHR